MKRRAGDPKLGIGYLRVSTLKQDLGPHAQRQAISEYARARGIRVLRWRVDKCSGSRPPSKRRGFPRALRDLRETGAGVLLIWKRDRLARGSAIMVAVMERAVEEAGGRVHSTQGNNEDTPEAVFVRRVLDAVAEFERELIRIRTRAAVKVKMRRHQYIGGDTPFGFRRSERGGLEEHPQEQEAVRLIQGMARRGWKSTRIARTLSVQQIPCRGSAWHSRTVRRILARGGVAA